MTNGHNHQPTQIRGHEPTNQPGQLMVATRPWNPWNPWKTQNVLECPWKSWNLPEFTQMSLNCPGISFSCHFKKYCLNFIWHLNFKIFFNHGEGMEYTLVIFINSILRWHRSLKPLLAFSMNSPIFPYIISYMTRNIILGYNKVHFGRGIIFGFFGKCGNFEGFWKCMFFRTCLLVSKCLWKWNIYARKKYARVVKE